MNGKILILGDVLIDKDILGISNRLSPEAPVPIVNIEPNRETTRLGGAANVALQIRKAGIECLLAYKSYTSESHRSLTNQIYDNCISPCPLIFDKPYPVTEKIRIWAGGQQIVRLDIENTNYPNFELRKEWFQQICEVIKRNNVKIVVFSDYNKGTITNEFAQDIIDFCKENEISVIFDPKRNDFYKLKNLFIIKPNKKELESTGLSIEKISNIMTKTYVVNTMGEEGICVYKDGYKICNHPAVKSEVVNVVSAGDCVNAVLAICRFKELNIEQSISAATKAASYVVKHMGSYILSKDELQECISGP